MKRIAVLCVLACLLCNLSGCGLWMNRSHAHVEPHPDQYAHYMPEELQASGYPQIKDALEKIVKEGMATAVIHITDMDRKVVESYMDAAISYIKIDFPVGAYAVEEITYEFGMNAGKAAVAVDVTYTKSRAEILRIKYTTGMEDAAAAIGSVLEQNGTSVAVCIDGYRSADFQDLVRRYADLHPRYVMETPQVMAAVYPERGDTRVVELVFTYQTESDRLQKMQQLVQPVFVSAALYVQGNAPAEEKFKQLYSFLMERYHYDLVATPTPTYSLLQEGIGDSRAFACVYAQMCTAAGLNCQPIAGTKNGEDWYWNVIQRNGRIYHIDLLRSNQAGGLRMYSENDMAGYQWDPEDIIFE